MAAERINKPRVLFICHQATLTGAPISLFRVLAALKRTPSTPFDFLVYVSIPGPLLDSFSAADIPYVCVPKRTLTGQPGIGRRTWERLKYYAAFIGVLLRYRPGVVYSNTAANSGEVTLARTLGAKTIVHVHEAESAVLALRGPLVRSKPFTTGYVAASQYVRAVLRRLLEVDSVVVYSGLAPSEAERSGARRESDERTLAVIGSICPNKGQLLAVEGLASLRASGYRTRLQLIGAAADVDYVAAVKSKCSELGITDYVDFTGQRGLDDVYAGIDVVLIPSSEETFSLVALEAMARGVLVVAASTGGIPELIRDGSTGLLFQKGNANEMASRVATALTHPAQAMAMVESARCRVTEEFGLDKAVRDVTRVIMDTMKSDE